MMKSKLIKRFAALALTLALAAVPITAAAPIANAETGPAAVERFNGAERGNIPKCASSRLKPVPRRTGEVKSSEIWDGSIASGFAGGSGTESDPYLISNGEQLAYLAQQVNGGNPFYDQYLKLTADIYLNDTSDWESWDEDHAPANEWTAIGSGRYDEYGNTFYANNYFDGVFDGDGYVVHGIYINKTGDADEDCAQGLFGVISGAELANTGVEQSYIHGYDYVGAVVGNSRGSTLLNCFNTGNVSGNGYVGGITGSGDVRDCKNSGSVVGRYDVGGIAGGGEHTVTVENCINTGKIYGEDTTGGITGYAGYIVSCTNLGDIVCEAEFSAKIGGIAGSCYQGVISYCHNSGDMNINIDANGAYHDSECANIGGIVGKIFDISDFFYCSKIVNYCYNSGSIHINASNYTDPSGEVVDAVIIACGIIGNIDDYYYTANAYNCYNAGSISATGDTGKTEIYAIGMSDNCYCYYLDDGSYEGEQFGTPLTEEQMRSAESYDGFDFKNVWAIEPDTGYPYPQFINGLDQSYGESSAIWDGGVAEGFDSGNGTWGDPYIIKTAEQLAFLASSVNSGTSYAGKYIRLDSDIRLNDYNAKYWTLDATEWTPIGQAYNNDQGDYDREYPFEGHFDGGNHTISGLYIHYMYYDPYFMAGLFGCSTGTIENLGIVDSYISCFDICAAGSVLGSLSNGGCVRNCYNKGTVEVSGNGSWSVAGGVVGCGVRMYSTAGIGCAVINCYNDGSVIGGGSAGGVVLYCSNVRSCHNTGTVISGGSVGGVVASADNVAYCYNTGNIISFARDRYGSYLCGGVVADTGNIYNCFNSGNVSSVDQSKTGGISGRVEDYVEADYGSLLAKGHIANCYNIGTVSGGYAGGIVCENYADIANCYNAGEITGKYTVYYYEGEADYYDGVAGGIMGWNNYDDEDAFDIINCYNVGKVTGLDGKFGGIVGNTGNSLGAITNAYYLDTACEGSNSYGTALTDAQLRLQESYAGFDFGGVWTMDGNSEYPYAEFVQTPHGSYPTPPEADGDIDGSGEITAEDALAVLRDAMLLESIGMDGITHGDMDGDGVLTAKDALIIIRMAMGLETL